MCHSYNPTDITLYLHKNYYWTVLHVYHIKQRNIKNKLTSAYMPMYIYGHLKIHIYDKNGMMQNNLPVALLNDN